MCLGSAAPSKVSISVSAAANSEYTDPAHSWWRRFPLCHDFEYLPDSCQRFPSHDRKRIVGIGRRAHTIQHTGDPRCAGQNPQSFSRQRFFSPYIGQQRIEGRRHRGSFRATAFGGFSAEPAQQGELLRHIAIAPSLPLFSCWSG